MKLAWNALNKSISHCVLIWQRPAFLLPSTPAILGGGYDSPEKVTLVETQ
jgi:hypothetical protein